MGSAKLVNYNTSTATGSDHLSQKHSSSIFTAPNCHRNRESRHRCLIRYVSITHFELNFLLFHKFWKLVSMYEFAFATVSPAPFFSNFYYFAITFTTMISMFFSSWTHLIKIIMFHVTSLSNRQVRWWSPVVCVWWLDSSRLRVYFHSSSASSLHKSLHCLTSQIQDHHISLTTGTSLCIITSFLTKLLAILTHIFPWTKFIQHKNVHKNRYY